MRDRYARQISMEGFGQKAQDALAGSSVAVVGIGGLGSPVCQYLAAAGVGKLILIDDQKVEGSNLNRQILHYEEDAGLSRYKVESARMKLKALNSEVMIEALPLRLEEDNVYVLENADVVVDCLDNSKARYVLNKHCLFRRVPLVHGAVEGAGGHVLTIVPGGPCLRCAFPKLTPRYKPVPVLGAAAGVIGSLQAMEVIKLIVGMGDPPDGRGLFFDLQGNQVSEVQFVRDPSCPDCGSL
ncbi:MAG: HesA/MoeB/ThiF family protein [Methanomassiliicoccales archaeon]|nr:HesA/MoeB/ThiF family protein [Methanomassiliicoccales archaeon]